MTGLFNLLALLYIGRSVQLAIRLVRDRIALRQEPLTRAKQRLAEQAAFFLGVPPAVLVHEAAHALAVLLFGGRVAEFGYRVFWGYVVPDGDFTAVENWIIAVAGTLGSLAFGALAWAVLRRHPSRTYQYFGLRTFRFQIYFSLLYYPVFSLFLPIGDWRVIYDFSATPLLSAATAVVHAAALLLFWRVDRAGGFEMVAFESAAEQSRYEMTRAAARAGDPQAELQAVSAMWAGGAPQAARHALGRFLAAHPDSAEGQLQSALHESGRQGAVSRNAAQAAERALASGLHSPDNVALAHRLIASHYLERGDGRAAETTLNAALSATATYDPARLSPGQQAELRYLRAQAYRRQGQYEAAYADAAAARRIAAAVGSEASAAKYAAEQQLIVSHAGRDLSGADEEPEASPGASGA